MVNVGDLGSRIALIDWCVGLYPLMSLDNHLRIGSMNIVNRNGERVSSCRVPLSMGIVGMFPWGVI